MNERPIAPTAAWAAIARSKRSRWVLVNTIRRTRKGARTAYLEGWDDRIAAMQYASIERVYVSASPPVECVPTGACLLRNT